MRAVWYEKKGPAAEVLVAGEMRETEPAPGEVRVRIAVSSVNPTDVKRRREGRELGRFARIVPDNDGAGTIDRVGASVAESRINERVWVFAAQAGRPFGTAAEYACVPARFAVPLPHIASFADGACLGVPAVTAHRCLFADGPIRGLSVLVSGGAGRVGAYAVQMAKRAGAFVIATASPAKQAGLKELGADMAFDYRAEDLAEAVKAATQGKGVDRIVETEFGANIARAPKLLAPNGVVASYASDAVLEPKIPFAPLMVLNATLRLVFIYAMPESAQNSAFADITEMLAQGALTHRIGARFPLARLADAHEAVERGTATGSVLVDI